MENAHTHTLTHTHMQAHTHTVRNKEGAMTTDLADIKRIKIVSYEQPCMNKFLMLLM